MYRTSVSHHLHQHSSRTMPVTTIMVVVRNCLLQIFLMQTLATTSAILQVHPLLVTALHKTRVPPRFLLEQLLKIRQARHQTRQVSLTTTQAEEDGDLQRIQQRLTTAMTIVALQMHLDRTPRGHHIPVVVAIAEVMKTTRVLNTLMIRMTGSPLKSSGRLPPRYSTTTNRIGMCGYRIRHCSKHAKLHIPNQSLPATVPQPYLQAQTPLPRKLCLARRHPHLRGKKLYLPGK